MTLLRDQVTRLARLGEDIAVVTTAEEGRLTMRMTRVAVTELLSALESLDAALTHEPEGTSMEHAVAARDTLIPPMTAVRAAADALEGLVADDLWPLPTYQEMLTVI